MDPLLEQRITSILDKLEQQLQKTDNLYNHQQRRFRLSKTELSFTKHVDADVSNFDDSIDTKKEEDDSKHPNVDSTESMMSDLTLTSRKSIIIKGQKIEISEFLDKVEEELNEISVEEGESHSTDKEDQKDTAHKSPSPKEKKEERKSRFQRLCKMEMILKTYLWESRASLTSAKKKKRKSAEDLYCQINTLFNTRTEIKNPLRMTLDHQLKKRRPSNPSNIFNGVPPKSDESVSKYLAYLPKDISLFNISVNDQSVSSINNGSVLWENMEPIEETIVNTEEDDDIKDLKRLCNNNKL